MSPLAVFFRTLSRSTAICLGVGFAVVNPSLEWSPGRPNALTPQMRMTGVTAQNSPNERAVDGLIFALKDSDAGVRRQAAIALAGMQSPRAVPGLIEALKDEQTDVRLHAIAALGDLGDARATQPLVQALKDSEPRVRGRAATALGEIRDRTTVEPLIALVRDSNVDVRRRAIRALSEIRDANAIPALTAALKDDDAGVRRAAVMALAELSGGDSHENHVNPNPRPNPNPNPNPEPESEPQSPATAAAVLWWRSLTVLRSSLALCALLTIIPAGDGGRGEDMGRGEQVTRSPRELTSDLTAADPTVRTRAACGLRELGDRAVDAIPAARHLVGRRGSRRRHDLRPALVAEWRERAHESRRGSRGRARGHRDAVVPAPVVRAPS